MTSQDLFKFCLRLGDTCLILSHRQSELCSKGPFLEEDIAQTNLGLDLLGQAESLLTYAAELEGNGRTADDLVFKRPERDFYNFMLAEQPNTDFSFTIVRQYFMSIYLTKVYEVLSEVYDEVISGISAKASKEISYHKQHLFMWLKRLGDGSQEGHERIQTAVNELWMFLGELYEEDELDITMQKAGFAISGSKMKSYLMRQIKMDLNEATLSIPENVYMVSGSKKGIHTEYLGYLLTEMQYLQRAYPDAKW
ncbi:MAG: phenylacetate-CoA oxygenase subunit PaaI [Flavobacteriales bacterium]|nr:phenylacetate-CoA oxygenase subunit PaaI [Flavobacteriales bacterium]|tara:strand:+ start:846 stop:1601 length:756 start_codon:yes stop_codon:yes gene_type:complete